MIQQKEREKFKMSDRNFLNELQTCLNKIFFKHYYKVKEFLIDAYQ